MNQRITPTEVFRKLKLFEEMVKDKRKNCCPDADIKDIFYRIILLFSPYDKEALDAVINYGKDLFCKHRPAVFRIIANEIIFEIGMEKDMPNV